MKIKSLETKKANDYNKKLLEEENQAQVNFEEDLGYIFEEMGEK
jgi:hypothetical protein